MRRFIFGVVGVGILIAIFTSRVQEFGLFRTVPNFNNDRCQTIKGLESCEDIFVDQPTGLAYLACSQLKSRVNWLPALDILNAEKLQVPSADYIAILDLKTHEYRKLSLSNLPLPLLKNGVYLHALDLFIHPNQSDSLDSQSTGESTSQRKATLYFINHRIPTQESSDSPMADSVIEVFDTFIGSDKATYRTTIKHDLILTPNNLVGMSGNSFYVTNDHGKKKHWTRSLEIVYPYSAVDCVVYCSFEETVECISALHGRYQFANGIAKGPNNLLYLANSFNAHVRFLEIQSDSTLKLKEEIKVPRHLDNIYVTKSGSIFLASIPSILKFSKLLRGFHKDTLTSISPSEVWKLSNETSMQLDKTKKFRLEKVFSDDGNQVSGITGVAVWNSTLILTGIGSTHVSACEIQQERKIE